MDIELAEMIAKMRQAPKLYQPSNYWESMNAENLEQLGKDGYNTFKRTINQNYFQWSGADGQKDWLVSKISNGATIRAYVNAFMQPNPLKFTRYKILTCLLYEYCLQEKIRCGEREPPEGKPIEINIGGQPISEDMLNSALEYDSMKEIMPAKRILEIGAGYGRLAWLILCRHPETEYTIIDIPPALWIAKKYLTSQFPNAKLKFLLPHEITTLPDNSFDLTINISSFQEMSNEQVENYLLHISRLSKYLYIKEWKEAIQEGRLKQADYKIKGWETVFEKECRVQEKFFEKLIRRRV